MLRAAALPRLTFLWCPVGAARVERALTSQRPFWKDANGFGSSAKQAKPIRLPHEWRWEGRVRAVEKVGEGNHGQVFVREVECGSFGAGTVAAKFIDPSDESFDEVAAEAENMGQTTACPRRVHDVSTTGKPDYAENAAGKWVMMPVMSGGDMSKLMLTRDESQSCHCNVANPKTASADVGKLLGNRIPCHGAGRSACQRARLQERGLRAGWNSDVYSPTGG